MSVIDAIMQFAPELINSFGEEIPSGILHGKASINPFCWILVLGTTFNSWICQQALPEQLQRMILRAVQNGVSNLNFSFNYS